MGGDNHIRRKTNSNNNILYNRDTKAEFGFGSDKPKAILNLRKVCPFAKHKLRKEAELQSQDLPSVRSEKEKQLDSVKSDENWSLQDLLNPDRNSSRPGTREVVHDRHIKADNEIPETGNYSRPNSDESDDSGHGRGSGVIERKQLKRVYNDVWASGLRTPLSALEDGETDSEDELLFGRRQSGISSSGSSMSWAEDAFENGQTDDLKNLWREVENACQGNGKADGMPDSVYEECLEWRRAFPAQCSAPSRFKFMMELEAEDEDSTPTPTNEASIREQFLVLDPSFPESRAEDCSTPNPETSAEYVSSWLFQCQISNSDEDSTVDLSRYGFKDGEGISSSDSVSRLLPQHEKPSSSSTAERFSSFRYASNVDSQVNLNQSPRTPNFPKLSSRSAYPTLHRPSAFVRELPKSEVKAESYRYNNDEASTQKQFRNSDRLGSSTKGKTRGLSSASWSRYSNNPNLANKSNFRFPVGQENLDTDDENCDTLCAGESQREFGTTTQAHRPSYLPLHGQQGDNLKYHVNFVRNNIKPKPVKPFMFWLFNNVSPN